MDLTPLIYMCVGAVGSLFMWLVLGPIMTGLGVKRLAHKAAMGDEKALEFFYELGDVLIVWAAKERIPTGEKIKVTNDKGDVKEIPELLSPIQLMARTIGSYVIMKFKGSVGGTKNQMKQMLMDEAAETGIGLSPTALAALARGKVGPALAEVGLPFLMDKLKKGGDNTSNQSGNYLK